MKKISINRRLRIGLISTTIILTCITSVFLYKIVKHPGHEEQKFSLYRYNNKASINYDVFLKPNILYEKKSLSEGELYITEYLDNIQASFKYNFNGERTAEIKGNYEILAQVEGYTGEDEQYRTIWKKDFLLVSKKAFQSKDKSLEVNEVVPVNILEYNNFAKQVIETSKVSCKAKLTVFMNVSVKANTDKGIVEDSLSPMMIIPLDTNYFNISGTLTEEKPGNIEETKEVQLPVNRYRVIIYGIILGLLLIMLIFIVLLTTDSPIKSPLQRHLKKIFKKHGDRLVALNSEVAATSSDTYSEVKSIEDLVRIADEIGKPIMYKYSKDYKEMTKFYVFDEKSVYMLSLNELVILSNEVEENEEKELSSNVDKLRERISMVKTSTIDLDDDNSKEEKTEENI